MKHPFHQKVKGIDSHCLSTKGTKNQSLLLSQNNLMVLQKLPRVGLKLNDWMSVCV
jgi:hypothetical protein